MLRRALLKAVAVPGYQVPFGSREMPLPYGWGTGGIQVTAAIIGPDDVLKVIDQGLGRHHQRHQYPPLRSGDGRGDHRIDAGSHHRADPPPDPEAPLRAGRSWCSRCRFPSRCAGWNPARPRPAPCTRWPNTAACVKLYEDIAQHGHIAATYDYPVMVNGRYMMRPSPIPKFDNPKLDQSPALMLFGAGREKRLRGAALYSVKSLDFEDHPFAVQQWDQHCELCGSHQSFLDEIILDDAGTRRRLLGHRILQRQAGAPAPAGSGMNLQADIGADVRPRGVHGQPENPGRCCPCAT